MKRIRMCLLAACPDPCDNHCSNGAQDCGETGVDCGGGKVVWNPGAQRGWWAIEPQWCP